MAERATNRDELMRVVNMMRDTNVETARRHLLQLPIRLIADLKDRRSGEAREAARQIRR